MSCLFKIQTNGKIGGKLSRAESQNNQNSKIPPCLPPHFCKSIHVQTLKHSLSLSLPTQTRYANSLLQHATRPHRLARHRHYLHRVRFAREGMAHNRSPPLNRQPNSSSRARFSLHSLQCITGSHRISLLNP